MSAGSKLRDVRQRNAYLETELLKLQLAAAASTRDDRARSLLRRLLPYARHKTACARECDCDLDDVREAIDDLLNDAATV